MLNLCQCWSKVPRLWAGLIINLKRMVSMGAHKRATRLFGNRRAKHTNYYTRKKLSMGRIIYNITQSTFVIIQG